MKKNRFLSGLILLLFSALLFLPGCQKKDGSGSPPGSSQPLDSDKEVPRTIQLNRPGDGEQPPDSEREEEPDQKDESLLPEFSGPLFLQKQLPQSRILPDGDFTGPFLDSFSTDQKERQIAVLLRNFFFSYQSGIVDKRFLTQQINRLFADDLETHKALGPEIRSLSTGSPDISGNRASIRVRIFSETGSVTGTVYVVSDGNKWFIEDWEIPFGRWPGDPVLR